MAQANQNPEQIARDRIDLMLELAGWIVQDKDSIDLGAGTGVAVREYQTSEGPADYVLFADRRPVGIIEAKREEKGSNMTVVEEQSSAYARGKLKHLDNDPLPFVYESTGAVTRFTDYRDPRPRSRRVFHFHQPGTLLRWYREAATLRKRLQPIPALDPAGLRPAQVTAITNLEASFKENRPRALIQMATGAGKTFTACTFVYRLLRHAGAQRILFLVDTRNLGEQAEAEFINYQPRDDNRRFTELYNVQRLSSAHIAQDAQVCISTIQRLYSLLQGEELDESADRDSPHERRDWEKRPPVPVRYSPANPISQFDFIIIDECHRSIYNLWRQVLEYYDAFLIGLTATPDKRTFGFFDEHLVSDYSFEESVADGVNVPYDIYTIETEIGRAGGRIEANQGVDMREKLSRRQRWQQLDEDFEYTAKKLDRDVVNPSQIRHVIREFKRILPQLYPERHDAAGLFEVPKTLVFAKTDSHADDIIQCIRTEFGEGNDFCKKLTYKIEEKPADVLQRFRNDWNPRIAVTVDMIATGTDVRPLEVLLFMRDVRSKNYYEQMKGRGTRSLSIDELRKVSSTARHAKTHFVIVDAIGIEQSRKTDSRPLEQKAATPLADLLQAVVVGSSDEALFSSLANRLIRLEKKLSAEELAAFAEKAKGHSLRACIKGLLNAHDPDLIAQRRDALLAALPPAEQTPARTEACEAEAREQLAREAAAPFSGELKTYVEEVRKAHEQLIDTHNLDRVLRSEWAGLSRERAAGLVQDFADYIAAHREEITALRILYNQPYQRRALSYQMIKELHARLLQDKPTLAPHALWEAYAQLEEVRGDNPKNALVALVSLLRRVMGLEERLRPFGESVDRNFQRWTFEKQAGALKFSAEQMDWLRMIRDHIASSFAIETDDLELTPFVEKGGMGKMHQLFGGEMQPLMQELNENLVA